MTFTSVAYFVFLPIVFFTFHAVREKRRWIVALVASYGFFASLKAPQTLCALVLVTLVSYLFGLRLGTGTKARLRAIVFWVGSAICLLLLVVIKYLPALFWTIKPESPLVFLLNSTGVSYFILQAISYLTDIYLETQEPERHLGRYALSLAFFPKIAQGPIERAHDILPQILSPKPFEYKEIRSGLLLFAFGLVKKTIIADRLCLYANAVYENPKDFTGIPILVATYAYALQIYFDFSGYTDMARGSARMFGIELSRNFNSPYSADSVADFWRRWHISFSRWILDYLFKPLQMLWRRIGMLGTALALLVTFLLSGAWHGVKAGFIIWGALHGIYLGVSVFYAPLRSRTMKRLGMAEGKAIRAWRVFVTFNLVCVAWVFFRANDLGDAWYVISHVLDIGGSARDLNRIGIMRYLSENILLNQGGAATIIVLAAIVGHAFLRRREALALFRLPTWLRWCIYVGIALAYLLLAAPSNQFIYFKF